jgi:polysaccharide deacetylase family sporulation protein PdaB
VANAGAGGARWRQLAAVCFLATLSMVYAGLVRTGAWPAAAARRELPVYNVDTQDKALAISFDAAWGSAQTNAILDILDQYGVRTTFFLVGMWVDAHPDLVREIAAKGHEVGNHSTSHPHMASLSEAKICEELRMTSDKVAQIIGKPTTLFRPPYGEYNDAVVRISRQEGYECVQWNVDSLDWKNRGAQDMIRRATNNIQPGDIVLFHNDSRYILDALPTILQLYAQAGYRVIPVSELLLAGETWIDHKGTQHQIPASTAAPTQITVQQ